MNLSAADIERWVQRLSEAPPSVVLREMAETYRVRSDLGFFMADLWPELRTPGVQAVWGWDFMRNGKGLTDDALNSLLAEMWSERRPQSG